MQPAVLAAQHGRPIGNAQRGHIGQHQALPIGRDDGQRAQPREAVPPLARVAQIDAVALQAFHRFPYHAPPYGAGHHVLHIGHVQAKARGVGAANVHVDVAPARKPLGQRAAHAAHVFHGLLYFASQPVDHGQVGARHFHTDRALDAGGQHVDAVAYGWYPDVGQAGHAHRAVEFFHQLVGRHSRAPFFAWAELYGGLEHFQRRRVGGGIGAAGFAVHTQYLGHRHDEAVGLLQQFGRLGRREARQRRGHVEQIAFIQRWHEFTAHALQSLTL